MEITSLILETKSEIRKIREQVQNIITVNIYLDDKAYKCYNNQLDELRYWIVLECFEYSYGKKASCLLFQDLPEPEGTICKNLDQERNIELSVSMTTRQPRQSGKSIKCITIS